MAEAEVAVQPKVYCRHCGAEWVQGSQTVTLADGTETTNAALTPNWLCPSCDHYQNTVMCPTCKQPTDVNNLPPDQVPQATAPQRAKE